MDIEKVAHDMPPPVETTKATPSSLASFAASPDFSTGTAARDRHVEF
jgi:hypothetical protein